MKNFNWFIPLTLVWFIMSCGVNVLAAYTIGSVSIPAQVVLITIAVSMQMILPSFKYYKYKWGEALPISSYVVLWIGMFWTMASFAVGGSVLLNTLYANTLSQESLINTDKETSKLNQFKADSIQFVDTSTLNTKKQELTELSALIDEEMSTPAHNFSGDKVYKNGKLLSVWDATNHCTSGIYFTNQQLHKSDCEKIKKDSFQKEILVNEINDMLSGKNRNQESVKAYDELMQGKITADKNVGRTLSERVKSSPVFDFIYTHSKTTCSGDDCELKQINAFKYTTFKMMSIIAIFLFMIEYYFINMSLLSIYGYSPADGFIKTLIKQWKKRHDDDQDKVLEAKGATLAKLEYEKNKANQKLKEEFFALSFIDLMKNMDEDTLSLVVDIDNFMEAYGVTIDRDEVVKLTLAVCHNFDDGAKLPIHSTINKIKSRLLDEPGYCEKIFDKSECNNHSFIDNICKPSRLVNIIFPLLDNILIQKDNKSYYWKDSKGLELLFKERIKNKHLS